MAKADLFTKPVEELDEAEAAAELKRLASEIAGHDRRYYEQDAPSVTDAEYDALRRRNAAIEARFPALKRADSPSERVGAAPSGKFATVRHAVPMLSLENAFTDDDVRDFVAQMQRFLGRPDDEPIALTAEPKIDGLSISLRYEDRQAGAGGDPRRRRRGRGRHRQCPHHPRYSANAAQGRARYHRGARRDLSRARRISTRSTRRRRAAGASRSTPIRATPRPGSLRQKDPAVTAARPLRFFAYAWGEASALPADSQFGVVKASQKWGFPVNPLMRSCARRRRGAGRLRRDRDDSGPALHYDIDGVVYKVDSLGLQERLGIRSALAALGDRPQVPGRAGATTKLDGHRHPGRPHRRAHAGGAAGAGHRRRRAWSRTPPSTTRTSSAASAATARCCARTRTATRSTSASATR